MLIIKKLGKLIFSYSLTLFKKSIITFPVTSLISWIRMMS